MIFNGNIPLFVTPRSDFYTRIIVKPLRMLETSESDDQDTFYYRSQKSNEPRNNCSVDSQVFLNQVSKFTSQCKQFFFFILFFHQMTLKLFMNLLIRISYFLGGNISYLMPRGFI